MHRFSRNGPYACSATSFNHSKRWQFAHLLRQFMSNVASKDFVNVQGVNSVTLMADGRLRERRKYSGLPIGSWKISNFDRAPQILAEYLIGRHLPAHQIDPKFLTTNMSQRLSGDENDLLCVKPCGCRTLKPQSVVSPISQSWLHAPKTVWRDTPNLAESSSYLGTVKVADMSQKIFATCENIFACFGEVLILNKTNTKLD